MDEQPAAPLKPAIPPPDLPKPTIPPPPDIKAVESPPTPSAAPVVKVRIREAGDSEESGPLAGSLAPFNTRMTAAVIDAVVAMGLLISALWILPGFADRIGWLLGFAYLVTRDSLPFLDGRSVGKRAMRLKVVTLDDKPLTGNWEVALIRNAVLAIPLFAFVEVFVLLNREDKPDRGRRLGDEWAKTKVIIAPEAPVAGES